MQRRPAHVPETSIIVTLAGGNTNESRFTVNAFGITVAWKTTN